MAENRGCRTDSQAGRQAQEWLQCLETVHLIIQLSVEEATLSLSVFVPYSAACYKSPHLQPIREDTKNLWLWWVSSRNNAA